MAAGTPGLAKLWRMTGLVRSSTGFDTEVFFLDSILEIVLIIV
jgi:hypothetical protein